MSRFTEDDLALLARPLYAFLTVAPRSGRWPAPRPVWFEVNGDGDLEMFSEPNAPKVGRLREQPHASVVVAAPTGEPEHWVSVEGTVTLHDEGGIELATRLAERYWGGIDDGMRKLLDEWRANGLVRLVLTPARVNRYAV